MLTVGKSSSRAGTETSSRLSLLLPRNWKISSRIALALFLPIVLAAGMMGTEIRDSLDHARQMKEAEGFTKTVLAAVRLAHALENERDFGALAKEAKVDMRPYRAETDRMHAEYQALSSAGRGGRLAQRTEETESVLRDLAELRTKAYTKGFESVATNLAYASMIMPLLGLSMEAARSGGSGGAEMGAMSWLSIGKASISSQRALLNAGFTGGQVGKKEQEEAGSHSALQRIAFYEFEMAADRRDVSQFKNAFDPTYISAMVGKAAVADRSELDVGLVKEWNTSVTKIIDSLHEIEKQIILRIATTAAEERYQAQRAAWGNSGLAAGALLLAMLLAAWIVRNMVGPLGKLRHAALDAARRELPALVSAAAAEHEDSRPVLRPVPLDLGTRDEIGDVSRAFEQVFREAVNQSSEQAKLRANVNSMLASMARRNQVLVHRQLEAISALEQTEADAERLGELFHLDHLATRMRRHGENLLLLAGESPGRVHHEPAPLVDVIRAAAAEVEQYARIEIVTSAEVGVAAPVVHDLTHLLAELLDNATQYSAPTTHIVAMSRFTLNGGVLIEIEDDGVGLSATGLRKLNAGLARPRAVDATTTRQMGLYVVSRLAAAHAIHVRLNSMGEGTTASVVLPPGLIVPVAALQRAAATDPHWLTRAAQPAPAPAPAPPTDTGTLPRRTRKDTLRGSAPAAGPGPVQPTEQPAPDPGSEPLSS
ncbi:nitrate- and nitrite sensing domain-containing protein [Streptomyces lavendulae]|uniref:sensor histidine kinase n=1 Tax=Streptomyces lavendulae TaxID=1914 RepID=UPI0033CCDA69